MLLFVAAQAALAQESAPLAGGPELPEPIDLPGVALETSVGFQLGQQDFRGTAWGRVSAPGAELTAPFARHPFDVVVVSGLHFEERLIWNQLRLGVGYQRGFPSYDFQRATRDYPSDGQTQTIAVERFAVHEVRLTIGVLAPLAPVAPYVDLAGDVRELRAVLSVGGSEQTWRSAGFGLSVVGGLRARTSEHTFLALQGEYGLTGTMFWGTQAMAGFSVL